MPSIHGLWSWSASYVLAEPFAQAMQAAMAPYGRLQHGNARTFSHREPNLLLAGNLQFFLPEDHLDRQPLRTPDLQSWLVADVRLDNRPDLIRQLTLTTPELLPDSEILLQAWHRWGPRCLDYIVGVFAFAVWTPARQELFLARDHTGERPLFYHRAADFFAFASMPKGLLAIPGVNRGVDEDTILKALTLARYSQSVSFFAGIDRLPPGHSLLVTPGNVAITQFWKPFAAPPPHFKRDADYAEAFLEIFDAAVAARLRSTGPIATQLSSGLDSSSVTASAAVQLAAHGQRLTAYTAVPRPGFHGRGAHGRLPDEGPGAAEVAALYKNIDHILVTSAGQDLIRTVTQLSDAVDEPVQNGINALWMSAILDHAAARGCTTLLVGARGNLTFSHFGLEALGQYLRRGRLITLARAAHSFRQKGLVSFRTSARFALAGLLPDALYNRIAGTPDFDLSYSAVNSRLAQQLHLREKMVAEFFSNHHDLQHDRLHLFQIYDFDTYATGYQAVHHIDVRDPCADRRVIDFCFGLPIEQYLAPYPASPAPALTGPAAPDPALTDPLLTGPVPRSLARRSMQRRLPATALTRTHRGQQGADWSLTIAEAIPALRTEIEANDQSPTARRLLDQPRMMSYLASFPDPTAPPQDTENLAAESDALCRSFSFGHFLRTHEPQD